MSYLAPNYTQIPNLLLEEHIKAMTEAEMRVALAIARKTFGWHKRQDKLSLSQLMELTGMSRQGVINGIEAGIARGIIRRESDGQGYLYELVIQREPVNEVDQNAGSASQRSGLALVNEVDQLKPQTSQRSRPTKERIKKERIKKGDDDDERARAANLTPSSSRRSRHDAEEGAWETAQSATDNSPSSETASTLSMRNDPNADHAAICATIQANGFGAITPIVERKVSALIADYTTEQILDALEVAVSANKLQLNYVEGILKNRKKEGVNGKQNHGSRNGRNGDYKQTTDEHESESAELDRQREYNERYTCLVADEINGLLTKDEAVKLWEEFEAEFPGFTYREL